MDKSFKTLVIVTFILVLISLIYPIFIYIGLITAIMSLCLVVYETILYKLKN